MGNKSLSSNEQSAIQGDIFTEGRKKILFHFKSYKEYSNSIPTINTIVNDAIDNINKGKLGIQTKLKMNEDEMKSKKIYNNLLHLLRQK